MKRRALILAVGLLALAYGLCLPKKLFRTPASTVIEDRDGHLLSARVAADGQWRFPAGDSVPARFEACILTFEDRWFRYHPGFNPVSFGRALWANVRGGRRVQGGSTITMQTVRLSRGSRDRSILEKLKETILATRLELRHPKDSILALYAANAPFGGNVVGLEAASWRYFGRPPWRLSWAEAAMLAVLPNAPALIHPGRNRDALRAKRDRLLGRLHDRGIITAEQLSLALIEPIPDKPLPLPDAAPHLLLRAAADGWAGRRTATTLGRELQLRMEAIVARHHRWLSRNEVHNAALLLLDVRTGEVLAYVGNVRPDQRGKGEDVDIITAPRSSGSILKPLLYAGLMADGRIMPRALIPDIPTDFSGYAPKNFFPVFDGAVRADDALARSLNVPAVFMLRDLGIPRFHGILRQCGLSTVTRDPSHYGLSLVLGGAETTLWDITSAYAHMGHSLLRRGEGFAVGYALPGDKKTRQPLPFGPDAAWLALEAITAVSRPNSEGEWQVFPSSQRIAWKTGTSFGLRDAWAVGVTPRHAIGVWVGNASGEGRPGITGLTAAAPLLFDALNALPGGPWFDAPMDLLTQVATCARSGFRTGRHCGAVDTVIASLSGVMAAQCPFCQRIFVNDEGKRADAECTDAHRLRSRPIFLLPPLQEWYFRKRNADYEPLPAWADGCGNRAHAVRMEWVYPRSARDIVIPINLDGTRGLAVFELAHTDAASTVFWHLDEEFIGTTSNLHKMGLAPQPGSHTLTVVDSEGEFSKLRFRVLR